MKVFRSPDVAPEVADPKNFCGRAHVKRVASIQEDERASVYWVRFEPGGRTNWHSHSGVQFLLVTEGRGRIQKWGEAAREIGAGDVVHIEPDEKHWHGAAPGTGMAHFAVNLNVTTSWLEPVSTEQYQG
jgi:quercetin dioxygenase-like cupin family protein